MRPKQACWIVLFILFTSAGMDSVKGVVEITPSEVAAVCQGGYQLEVICSTSSVLHTWQLIANPESGAVTPLRQVTSVGSPGVESEPIIINSTIMITFSRLSSSPLTSRMTVNPVSEGLNGSRVNCVDGETSESATITILIIGDTPPAKPSIRSHSEQFSSDRIVAILEWTLSNSLGRYQQLLLPNVSINIVPDPEVEIMLFGNMSTKVTLHYNTLYNVSLTQPGVCGQPNQTAFIELNYTKCYNPGAVIIADLIIEGYADPALEGKNITLTCGYGLTLIGPNSSTCMGNGEWEPEPREVNCIGGITISGASTITLSTCSNPLYVLKIKADPSVISVNRSLRLELNKTPVCCSGFLITKSNTTTCLETGEWELETSQIKSEEMPDPATTAMLRTALISVTCLSIIMSTLTFVIGFVCGHYFSQRWKESATSNQNKENVSNTTNEGGEDLDLKENVAYITLRPK